MLGEEVPEQESRIPTEVIATAFVISITTFSAYSFFFFRVLKKT
jgi:hypothetical protein